LRDLTNKAENDMAIPPNAYLVGGGIGSMAAAAFMIRDGQVPGQWHCVKHSFFHDFPSIGMQWFSRS
jgi:myosin-crossreactive antigen